MRSALFPAAVLIFFATAPASAASLSVNFTNMSGETINELAATPKGATEVSTQNILSAPIANGDGSVALIEAADGECVFNLTFTFASGTTLERPDSDLCQSDGIVIE